MVSAGAPRGLDDVMTVGAVFDGLSAGVAVLEASGDYACARHNRAFVELLRAPLSSRETVAGLRVAELVEPSSFPAIRDVLERVRERGEPVAIDEFAVSRSGERLPRFYQWRVTPVTEEGRLAWLVVVIVDVSATVRARRAAEDERARLRFLADCGGALASSLDLHETLDRAVHVAVPTFADLCTVDVITEGGELERVALAHVDASREAELRAVAAGYAPGWHREHPVGRVVASGVPELERDLPAPIRAGIAAGAAHLELSRAIHPTSYLIVPLRARGGVLGAVGFVSTRDDRRYDDGDLALAEELARRIALAIENARLFDQVERARAALSAERDRLRELERQKDEFLSAASHDLRAPLTSIRLRVQLLDRRRRELDEAATAESLRAIDRVVGRATTMLDQLMDVTRLEMGRPLDLDRQPTDLVALVREAVLDAEPARDHATIHVEARVPELVGAWDPARLARVVGNLVSNAVKYSPAREPITITVDRDVADGAARAVLVVSDAGIGIPEAELPRVFERFYRASNVVGRIRGTGIGLAAARQIVEEHRGTIAVSSRPGGGTTFTVRLPIEPPPGA